jgi:hypothetical protein
MPDDLYPSSACTDMLAGYDVNWEKFYYLEGTVKLHGVKFSSKNGNLPACSRPPDIPLPGLPLATPSLPCAACRVSRSFPDARWQHFYLRRGVWTCVDILAVLFRRSAMLTANALVRRLYSGMPPLHYHAILAELSYTW